MKLFRSIGALLCALTLAAAVPAMAQEQAGAIEGVVSDATGAVVPGVTVEAKGASGVTQNTVSDTSGFYRFPALPPGTYVVSGSKVTYRPVVAKNPGVMAPDNFFADSFALAGDTLVLVQESARDEPVENGVRTKLVRVR